MAQTFPFRNEQVAHDFPFDPFSREGDNEDATYYILKPGENFLRPWISVPGGIAFVFPLGLEAFSLSIDPTLGIHRFVGDNKVVVDVVHKGEERFSMTGSFPGKSSVSAFRALRQVVYADTPANGKIVYIPYLMPHAQRMVVASARFDRSNDERGMDLSYDIEFVRVGTDESFNYDTLRPTEPITQPSPGTGTTTKKFRANSKYNSLRKIAALKYKNASKWQRLYTLNAKWFKKRNIPAHKAPDYRLPLGTVIYY